MPPGERREYAGNAPPRTLTSGIDNAATSIAISDGTGWPTGAVGPFFVVIDKGLTTEEKVKIQSRTGNTLAVAASGRGVDGTSAASHSAGAAVEHVLTAIDASEANQHYSDITIDHHTQYLNVARHDTTARHSPAVLDMAAITASLIPPGVMWDFAGASAPTGWLLCDGSAVSRATYSALFTAIGTAYGTGDGTTTFNLPDCRSRSTVGASTQNAVGGGIAANVALGAGLTARARGATFGAETVALAVANLPAHGHNHQHSGTTGNNNVGHTHGLENHSHWVNGVGNHSHQATRNDHYPILIAATSALGLIGPGRGLDATSDAAHTQRTSDDGGHDHGWTGGAANGGGAQGVSQNHNHAFTTGFDNTQTGSGTAVSLLNPGVAVLKIIKT